MISVIIPTYHPGNYLLECLNSLKSQTIYNNNYEILIILNGEKEPYFSVIQEWIIGFNCHVRVLYSEQKGVSYARNLGIDNADGDYIAFIDDDDYVSSGYLHGLQECVKCNPKGTIVCSDVRTFDSTGNLGIDYISQAFIQATENTQKKSLFNLRSFLSSSCCKLIPMSCIRERRFHPNIRIGEDALFMASISDRITNIALSHDDTIYYRRLRLGSASRRSEKIVQKFKRKSNLVLNYTTMYLKGFQRYNFLFILSRIFATIFKS